ncbi:HNH endonuclease signature motif containing protein [Leifsonia sp. Leaf264]|uniref:HNH endonuclease signature motif containing protein n=1 Tax=Leifsonia sp. Leaf264 TaxID=1736314 RepID=UPI0006FEC2E8|nr:HNH endonuclease signature motif containing protein [Leifsonia sp. Leaf264]KQO95859.1 hypothetical protein ASF30_19960 [Leifsonia sp. Leaf264]
METLQSLMQEALAAAMPLLAEATTVGVLPGTTDEDLLAGAALMEEFGRPADAGRIAFAGEVADRSRGILGPQTLPERFGCATPVELLERVARVSPQTARARLKLGIQTRPGLSLSGEALPAPFDVVRRGLATGRLGIDSATAITTALSKAMVGCPTDTLSRFLPAEHELVCAAIGASPAPDAPALPPVTPAETNDQASVWVLALNPDGAEPSVTEFESRSLRLHRPRNGLIPVSGSLLPEVAGQLQAVFDATTNVHSSLKFLTEEERAALEADEGPRDPRSRVQRQHDVLAAVFALAGRSEELPTLNGASATMVTHVLATDLDEHTGAVTGAGHVDGLDVPLSAGAVEQLCCANGIQPVTISTDGEILRLGSTERCFNRAQRRALAARDGGCIICGIAPQFTEAHHVIAWAAVKATHVSNGVLLCWFHHRTINTSGWRIRMVNGHPEIMPPPALGLQVWRPPRGSRTRQQDALARRLRN